MDTRSTPTYSSGNIPAAGSGNRAVVLSTIETVVIAFQSNGEQAWEIVDDLNTGGKYDKVFHSVGNRALGSGSNKGDTDIWFRTKQSVGVGNIITCMAYQDWSPTSHTGFRQNTTSGWVTGLSDSNEFDWWAVVNEYEIIFVLHDVTGGAWSSFSVGQVMRPYHARMDGVARITSQGGTGDEIVFGLDRDISAKIQIGQGVWFVNQTPSGQSLQSVEVDICTVIAITANSITVNGVTNTYALRSLCGLDPTPVYSTHASPTAAFVSLLDGTYTSTTGQAADAWIDGKERMTYSHFDPGPDGNYWVGPIGLAMTHAPRSFRGWRQHVRSCPVTSLANEDVLILDFDTSDKWKVFIGSAAIYFDTYWVLLMGPGAS